MTSTRIKAAVVAGLILWSLALYGLLWISAAADVVARAIVGMAFGLLFVWVGAIGGALWHWRAPLAGWCRRVLPLPAAARFVLLAMVLALIEEAVATTLSGAAGLFGDASGRAMITASRDYVEVVTQHSVVVFVPMFVVWALLLRRRAYTPFAVLLLFGCNGLLAETLAFGPQNLLGAGFWVLVYGTMVYAPAWTMPRAHLARAGIQDLAAGLFLPVLAALPVALLVLFVASP